MLDPKNEIHDDVFPPPPHFFLGPQFFQSLKSFLASAIQELSEYAKGFKNLKSVDSYLRYWAERLNIDILFTKAIKEPTH